jgi:hypothetical protein
MGVHYLNISKILAKILILVLYPVLLKLTGFFKEGELNTFMRLVKGRGNVKN